MTTDGPSFSAESPSARDPDEPQFSLSSEAAERVLARAVELQAVKDQRQGDFDVEALERVADEMGLDRALIRQAIVEEHAKEAQQVAGSPSGSAEWLTSKVVESRIVDGEPETLLKHASQWLEKQEGFQVRRRTATTIVSRPAQGTLAQIKSGLGLAGSPSQLEAVDEVRVMARQLDRSRTMLTVQASVRKLRRQTISGVGIGLLLALLGSWGAWLIFGVTGLLAVPAFALPAIFSVLRYVRSREEVGQELDVLLEAAAHPDAIPDTKAKQLGKSVSEKIQGFLRSLPD